MSTTNEPAFTGSNTSKPRLALLPLPKRDSTPKEDTGTNEYEVLTPLKESQKSAKEWIIHREVTAYGTSGVLGGLFCDPPGMGKTLSMIAAMQKQPGHAMAPTLIIVPPQVITVWFEEFIKRTTLDRKKIFIYYGPNRHRCEVSEETLFVISTYAILRNECLRSLPKDPDTVPMPSRSGAAHMDAFIKNSVFNCEFYRVILDEAHIAKNHKTKVSMALTWLSAHIKWIITATPKINSLDDEYGTFRFLGIFNSWEEWRSIVPSTANGVSASKLPRLRYMQQVIEGIKKDIMLRRPKALLNLPPKTDLYVALEFSQAEKRFYEQLQIYALSRVDSLEQTKEAMEFRAYASDIRSSALQMIARLKMATNNCFFVINSMKRLKTVKTIEEATKILSFYNKSANRAEECMICQDCSADHVAPCGHKFCLKCWINMFARQDRRQRKLEEAEALGEDTEDESSDASAEAYDENIPEDHLMENRLDSDDENRDEGDEGDEVDEDAPRLTLHDDEGACPQCSCLIPTKSLTKIDTKVHDNLLQSLASMKFKTSTLQKSFCPTKVMKMKELVSSNIEKTKLIIVSQSIPMLNYVNDILEKLYPGTILRIDGQRKVEDRNNDIKVFQDAKSTKRILLFSLTCNPEGITLTRATILIHLDHWWNKNGKVEQINDRIHRISQELPTTIYYLYIDKTIENKIFELQDHKYQLINYDFDNLIAKPRLISVQE